MNTYYNVNDWRGDIIYRISDGQINFKRKYTDWIPSVHSHIYDAQKEYRKEIKKITEEEAFEILL